MKGYTVEETNVRFSSNEIQVGWEQLEAGNGNTDFFLHVNHIHKHARCCQLFLCGFIIIVKNVELVVSRYDIIMWMVEGGTWFPLYCFNIFLSMDNAIMSTHELQGHDSLISVRVMDQFSF